jgi:hypothetical protein
MIELEGGPNGQHVPLAADVPAADLGYLLFSREEHLSHTSSC